MCAVSRGGRGRRTSNAVAAIVCIILGASVVLALMQFIDHKLNQSAENQVLAFTEQAASNVADRMAMKQNALGAFAVQSSDPAELVPALNALKQRNGFARRCCRRLDRSGLSRRRHAVLLRGARARRDCAFAGHASLFGHVREQRRRARAFGPATVVLGRAAIGRAVCGDPARSVHDAGETEYVRRTRVLYVVRGSDGRDSRFAGRAYQNAHRRAHVGCSIFWTRQRAMKRRKCSTRRKKRAKRCSS